MRTPNPENNVCPICETTLKKNGKTKLGKIRFRCPNCGFNETQNSTAHNRTRRQTLDLSFFSHPLARSSSLDDYVSTHIEQQDNVSVRLVDREQKTELKRSSSENQKENTNKLNLPLRNL